MALVQRVVFKMKPIILTRVASKNYSTEPSIKKSVFISQSKDVYTNLALQDWIYKNLDLSHHHVLMLWQNDPCVVIGKNQNPWLEANVDNLPNITTSGVKFARQKTDSESMYHDNGNLNMTFFTPKDHFNKKFNMGIVSRAAFREFSLKMDSAQEDFKLRDNYKISGSTKKVGTKNAYHHCNLLVKVNKMDFIQSLNRKEIGIQANANMNDIHSGCKIMNVCEENSDVTVNKLLKAVGWEYMRTPAFALRDGGNQLASEQMGFQMINPTDNWFPGINQIRDSLSGWEWLYGESPEFKVTQTISLPNNLSSQFDEYCRDLSMGIRVSGGIIRDVTMSIPSNLSSSNFNGEIDVVTTTLIGRKFSPDLLNNLKDSIEKLAEDKEKLVSEGRRKVMTSF